jgi:hypothetical protein
MQLENNIDEKRKTRASFVYNIYRIDKYPKFYKVSDKTLELSGYLIDEIIYLVEL